MSQSSFFSDLNVAVVGFLEHHKSSMPAFASYEIDGLDMANETFECRYNFDDGCCILRFYFPSRRISGELHMELSKLKYDGQKQLTHCARTGTEYVTSLRYFLQNFFESPEALSVFNTHRVADCYFHLTDVSFILWNPSLKVTGEMVRDTQTYLETRTRKRKADEHEGSSFDARTDEERAAEAAMFAEVQRDPKLTDFIQNLTSHPTFAPYLTSDLQVLARMVVSKESPKTPDDTLLFGLWYRYILPLVAHKTYPIPTQEVPTGGFVIQYPIRLSMLAVLGQTGHKPETWYMRTLGLEAADHEEFLSRALEVRRMNFVSEYLPRVYPSTAGQLARCFSPLRALTVHEAIQAIGARCKEHQCSFYDAFVFNFVLKTESLLASSTRKPHRNIQIRIDTEEFDAGGGGGEYGVY